MFGTRYLRLRRLPASVGAVAVAAVITATSALAIGASSAGAMTYPSHQYWVRCDTTDYWADTIAANPKQIDAQDGVGTAVINSGYDFATGSSIGSSANTPVTAQWIYYQLWAWSYKYQGWLRSGFKRSNDGFPGNGLLEAFFAGKGWEDVLNGLATDYQLSVNEVGVHPPHGSGQYAIYIETYWAPPYVTEPTSALFDPDPASGGLRVDDYVGTCTF